MENEKWTGLDVGLETSLFDYGFIAKQKTIRDYPDEWFVLYMITPESYGTSYIRESELNDLMLGKEWMNDDDIKGILSFVGNNLDEWLTIPFIDKLNDLLAYCGSENVLGSEYYPIDERQARKMAGIESEE